MYKICFFLISFVNTFSLCGQLITTKPNFPKDVDPVIIYFDATQGTGGLKDCACKIYLHTGVITDKSTSNSDWKYVQTTWGVANSNWEMNPVPGKPNLYSFEVNPSIRAFYKVPSSEKILRMAFVFRNANGSKEGKDLGQKDIFYNVFEKSGLKGLIEEPNISGNLIAPGDLFNLKVIFSESVKITVFDKDSLIVSKEGMDIKHSWIPSGYGFHPIRIFAITTLEDTISLQTNFIVVPEPKRIIAPVNTIPGFQRISSSKIRISVEAPGKKHLFLLGEFNNWKINTDYLFNLSPDGSLHWIELENIPSDKSFLYQIAINDNQRFADPYAPLVLDPFHDKFITPTTFPALPIYPEGKTSGIVTCIDSTYHYYQWKYSNFNKIPSSDLIIYELHIRDFLNDPNYKKLKDTLQYLVRLGINAIELMPVNEFEGNNSWGYNPSYHFALDKYYGTPANFKGFIDECHKNGIAVILDIVLNHAFSQSPLCKLFWDELNSRPSPENPWFNTVAKHDFNVGYDFNHESRLTKEFSKRVMTYWLTEYKIDGFRFDLSKGFTQKNTLGNTGAWGNYDASRIAIWEDYQKHLTKINPNVYTILEHFADNPEEVELSNKGMLLWGNMNFQFNEATMGYTSNLSGLDYKRRNFSNPSLIQYMESHDEERLMVRNYLYGKRNEFYDTRSLNTALQRMEMAFSLFLLSPGPKMIWQFGELGFDYSINTCEDGSVNNNCRLSPKPIPWNFQNQFGRRKLYEVVSSLNKLRTTYQVFKELPMDYDLTSFSKFMHYKNYLFDALVLANTNIEPSPIKVSNLKNGWWYSYFSKDSIFIDQNNMEVLLKPGEYRLLTTTKISTTTTISPTTSVNENSNLDFNLNIFPNPTNQFIEISYKGDLIKNLNLDVYDFSGKWINSIFKNESIMNGFTKMIDLNGYPAGPYILNLKSEKINKSFLISKTR